MDGEDQSEWSERDEELIEVLGEGWSYPRAAAATDLSAKTVQRRMSDPVFANAVSARRRERVRQISAALARLATNAVDVLLDNLASEDPKFALRAAALTLDQTRKWHGTADGEEFARRLTDLEQRVRATDGDLVDDSVDTGTDGLHDAS